MFRCIAVSEIQSPEQRSTRPGNYSYSYQSFSSVWLFRAHNNLRNDVDQHFQQCIFRPNNDTVNFCVFGYRYNSLILILSMASFTQKDHRKASTSSWSWIYLVREIWCFSGFTSTSFFSEDNSDVWGTSRIIARHQSKINIKFSLQKCHTIALQLDWRVGSLNLFVFNFDANHRIRA